MTPADNDNEIRHQELTEEILDRCIELLGPDSNFAKVKGIGAEFRDQGLTPLYFYDRLLGTIEVVTMESVAGAWN